MLYRTIICFALVLGCLFSSGVMAQSHLHSRSARADSVFNSPAEVRRWVLTFNPLGLIEWPGTLGLGVGYRFSQRLELWSETSYLGAGLYNDIGYSSGFKQVLQAKFFSRKNPNFFWAVEARYKTYQKDDTGRFVNDSKHDTLNHLSSFAHYYFWGGAFQVGYRTAFSKSKRLQFEITFGIGARQYTRDWPGVPSGYKLTAQQSTDLNLSHLIFESPGVYFPGSVRLIWMFGKRLRP